jgi:hypothetical protein
MTLRLGVQRKTVWHLQGKERPGEDCPTSRNAPFPVLLSSSDATFCAHERFVCHGDPPVGSAKSASNGNTGLFPMGRRRCGMKLAIAHF